jgi:hypothetical protein
MCGFSTLLQNFTLLKGFEQMKPSLTSIVLAKYAVPVWDTLSLIVAARIIFKEL